MKFISRSPEDLDLPANELAKRLANQSIVIFQGNMGVGKTTLIKAICKALGVEDEVSSPTFSLVQEYSAPGRKPIYHFDFYRILDEREVLDIGIFEYLDSGICLMEWPEKIAGILSQENYITVRIDYAEGQRIITFDC
jgi:tRNA threonylcarbamoyladenosine biosynthesis protein TsaE